jgi:hypothetical protein
MRICIQTFAHVLPCVTLWRSIIPIAPAEMVGGAPGPELTSAVGYDVATLLRRTGYSCDMQHFEMASDGSAVLQAIHRACSVLAATANATGKEGG